MIRRPRRRQSSGCKVSLSIFLSHYHPIPKLRYLTVHDTGFEGASAISSNAYFGRPEDDVPDDDYGDLESAAKDFVRKFGITAGDDLENISNLVGEGASRLQGAIRNYLNS